MNVTKIFNKLIKAFQADVLTSEFTALLSEVKIDTQLLPNVTDVCESFLDGVLSKTEAEAQIRFMIKYGKIKK